MEILKKTSHEYIKSKLEKNFEDVSKLRRAQEASHQSVNGRLHLDMILELKRTLKKFNIVTTSLSKKERYLDETLELKRTLKKFFI